MDTRVFVEFVLLGDLTLQLEDLASPDVMEIEVSNEVDHVFGSSLAGDLERSHALKTDFEGVDAQHMDQQFYGLFFPQECRYSQHFLQEGHFLSLHQFVSFPENEHNGFLSMILENQIGISEYIDRNLKISVKW